NFYDVPRPVLHHPFTEPMQRPCALRFGRNPYEQSRKSCSKTALITHAAAFCTTRSSIAVTVSAYSGVAPDVFRFTGGHPPIPPVKGPAAERSLRAQTRGSPPVRSRANAAGLH